MPLDFSRNRMRILSRHYLGRHGDKVKLIVFVDVLAGPSLYSQTKQFMIINQQLISE